MGEPERMGAPAPAIERAAEQVAGNAARPVVILNPASDGGRAARLRATVERALLGGRGDLALTTRAGDATRLAAEAARLGRPVVVVGGDGAIHEAAGVLAEGGAVTLGVVPAGSGNDFATGVARAPRDPLRALKVALAGPVERVDAGMVNGEYFVNALSVGLDAHMAQTAERLKRYHLTGQSLYLTAALRELLLNYGACPTLTLDLDGAPLPQAVYALVAMSLGPTYGGGFRINPGADPCDGLFDVCMLSKPPLLRALRLLPAVERGRHVSAHETRIVRCARLSIAATRRLTAQLDGELIYASHFDVRLLPGALPLRRGPLATR